MSRHKELSDINKSIRIRIGDQAGQDIARLWGDVPVMDSRKDLRIFIQPEDLGKAVGSRKDPSYCVFAQACRRAFRATKVLFYRSVAYIELPTESGARRVERFTLDRHARKIIEDFDRGKGVIPEAGFLLKAPRPSETLGGIRKQSASQRANVRRKLKGEMVTQMGGTLPDPKPRDRARVANLDVRSGVGAVHFSRRPAKAKSS